MEGELGKIKKWSRMDPLAGSWFTPKKKLLKLVMLLLLFSHWLFCNPMDCKPEVSSVHRISQARILEWVAIYFSKGSSWSRDEAPNPHTHTPVSCNGREILYHWVTREAPNSYWLVMISTFAMSLFWTWVSIA